LAIGSALPTFAQQTNTPDPQLRQKVLEMAKNFENAWNNNDASALAGLFTEDAVLVNDSGPVYGREAIKKYYADLFQKVHFSNQVSTLDQDSPHLIGGDGNEVWETVAWSATIQAKGGGPIQIKGYASSIAVREGGVWKKRMLTVNLTPAPPAPAKTQ
jgi:uncharacterized protein (TIGR02246 family)